jgi:hypothetical protein
MTRLDNPKKNPLARRKNRPRLIGGAYIPADLLAEAQKRRIEMVEREIATQTYLALPLQRRVWIRIKLFFINLWKKIRRQ